MLLKQMWMAGLDWDEELTEPLTNAARAWFSELPELTLLQIPRCLRVGGKQIDNVSLHTFLDASEDAFGAVAYVRYSNQDGTISTNIVATKTRVAPTTATSIPRLELMGAVIRVRLSTRIARILELQMSKAVSFCQVYRVTDEALIAETVVWPNFFLMNIFFALKGSKLFIIICCHCSWMLCRVAAVKSLPALIFSADYILLLIL